MDKDLDLLLSKSSSNNSEKIQLRMNESGMVLSERPKRSIIQLFKMGSVYFGIEMLFSIEMALTVKYI